jgi:hypothetical protein
MAESKVRLMGDEGGMFVVVDGVRVARRAHPGSSQTGSWVSIEPGWEVFEDEDLAMLHIRYNGITVH